MMGPCVNVDHGGERCVKEEDEDTGKAPMMSNKPIKGGKRASRLQEGISGNLCCGFQRNVRNRETSKEF